MTATDVLKWVVGVAVSAFLAGFGVSTFVDSRIQGHLEPINQRVAKLEALTVSQGQELETLKKRVDGFSGPQPTGVSAREEPPASNDLRDLIAAQRAELAQLKQTTNSLIVGDTRAVRFNDYIALKTAAAGKYVGSKSGRGALDSDRDSAKPDEAFKVEPGNPLN